MVYDFIYETFIEFIYEFIDHEFTEIFIYEFIDYEFIVWDSYMNSWFYYEFIV